MRKLRSAGGALALAVACVGLPACSRRTHGPFAAGSLVDLARAGSVHGPSALALEPDGAVVVAEPGANRVVRIGAGGDATPVAGTGTPGNSGDGGPATSASLNAPSGVAVGRNGDVYVADKANNRIRRVDAQGVITTVAGNGQRGYQGDGGQAANAVLSAPSGVAVGPNGDLFVLEESRVRRVDVAGRISTVAGGGTGRVAKGTRAKGPDVDIGHPSALAVGTDDAIYIAVPADGWVLRVGGSGELTVLAGDRDGAVDDLDGPAGQAQLDHPVALAADRDGSLYVLESGNGRIRRVDRGGQIHTVMKGGPATTGGAALTVGKSGDLLLALAGDRLVRLPRGTTAVVPPPKPTLTAMNPSQGGDRGQASVVLQGSGFSPVGGTTVTFGGQPAQVLHVSPDVMLVVAPPFPAGKTVDVVVSTRAGSSRPSVASRFTYTASWETTGSMATPRLHHTATALASGQVLVAGGDAALCFGCAPLASAELYDPSSATWTPTGSLRQARTEHTATLLPDGRALVSGGRPDGPNTEPALPTAEVYNPASGSWAATGAMSHGRSEHTATLLPSGQVLVAGGFVYMDTALLSVELYDPASGAWRQTDPMNDARGAATATLLGDGRVLVTGGLGGAVAGQDRPLTSAELYDPKTGMWTRTGDMAVARWGHTATLLRDGRVLVVGGIGTQVDYLQSAELYDPVTGRWQPAALPIAPRGGHTATLVASGSVLVAGGSQLFLDNRARLASLATVELYDPSTDRWSPTRILNTGRGVATATVLGGPACQATAAPRWCGAVLIAGGGGTNDSPEPLDSPLPLATAEIYR